MPNAARHARIAWSSNATGAPNTAMMPSPVNLSTVPPYRCTTAAAPVDQRGHDLAQPLRPDRRRDVHRMHHVGEQNGDLFVLGPGIAVSTSEPQPWQNRAFSRGSVPHVRHAAMAVIRPSADPGPSWLQGAPRIGGQTLNEDPRRSRTFRHRVLRLSYVVFSETFGNRIHLRREPTMGGCSCDQSGLALESSW